MLSAREARREDPTVRTLRRSASVWLTRTRAFIWRVAEFQVRFNRSASARPLNKSEITLARGPGEDRQVSPLTDRSHRRSSDQIGLTNGVDGDTGFQIDLKANTSAG